jgi:hypothetical protein
VKIVVGRWGEAVEPADVRESLIAAGADQVGASLRQTRDQITNLRPFIALELRAQSAIHLPQSSLWRVS